MDILKELKKQLMYKNVFTEHGPSTDLGQEWLSRTKELLARVDHGMAAEFDELGIRSALPLSSLTIDPILTRMMVILRNAINYLELADSSEKSAKTNIKVLTWADSEGADIHRKYWGHVSGQAKDFILNHRWLSSAVVIVLVLVTLTVLGYAKYIPEFNFPIGTFSVEGITPSSDSQRLDRSIFDLAKETTPGSLTSQKRVDLVSNLSGLSTREESGTVEDIGIGGSTLLIRGNGSDGSFIGIVRCDFSWFWKQRIALIKRGDQIKFLGAISNYDISRDWIVLKGCKLLN